VRVLLNSRESIPDAASAARLAILAVLLIRRRVEAVADMGTCIGIPPLEAAECRV
jgi:hypothetical protein